MKLLTLLIFFIPLLSFAEDAPEAEYPYPSKKKQTINIEKPIKVDAKGAYYYETSKKKKNIKTIDGVEKPVDRDSDGAYYYNTNSSDKISSPDGVESPIDNDDDGSYYYKRSPKKKNPKGRRTIQKPSKVLQDGTYVYSNQNPEKVTNTLYIRAGVYGPPDLQGATQNYRSVYSDKSSWIINADYEWKMFDFLGELLVKFGSGITIENGDGQFASDNNNGTTPKEQFQFIMFPNTLSLSYKAQLWNIQYLTPYFDLGAGYYTFWERRSDDKKNSFGGAPVASVAAGLLVSLSIFGSGTGMASDYGIRQTWIDLQYRQVLGLDSKKDFSSNMITGGFAVGF